MKIHAILHRWLCLGFIIAVFSGLTLVKTAPLNQQHRGMDVWRIPYAEAEAPNETPASTHGFDVFQNLRIDQGPGVQGSTSLAENIKESAKKQNVDIITALIFRAINIMILTIGTAGFVVLFVNGVKLVTNNGDEGAIDSAKGAIVPTLIGLIVTFLAYYIVTFFQSLFYSI